MTHRLITVDKLANIIKGEWVEVADTQAVINPATKKEIVQVPLSTSTEVDEAVQAAKRAQKDWALVPAQQRGEVLYRIGQIMKDQKEDLATLLTLENGKVVEQASGEAQEGIDVAFDRAGER